MLLQSCDWRYNPDPSSGPVSGWSKKGVFWGSKIGQKWGFLGVPPKPPKMAQNRGFLGGSKKGLARLHAGPPGNRFFWDPKNHSLLSHSAGKFPVPTGRVIKYPRKCATPGARPGGRNRGSRGPPKKGPFWPLFWGPGNPDFGPLRRPSRRWVVHFAHDIRS